MQIALEQNKHETFHFLIDSSYEYASNDIKEKKNKLNIKEIYYMEELCILNSHI